MDWISSHTRRLHKLLRRRGVKHHDAEDVIQDAFLKMQMYCNEGGQVHNSEAFLVRTVLNLFANSRAKKKAVVFVEETEHDPVSLGGLAPAPDEEVAAEDCLRQVSSLVDGMTSRTRQIFLLHYIENYSYAQIASQLGISVSAIEKHVARAMLALTQEFPGNE